jgi:hypothetical protein
MLQFRNAVIKNWQRSWGTGLALLALLAWCMPTLAIGCITSAMQQPTIPLHCSAMNLGALPDSPNMQQMPCCHKIPVPSSLSSHSNFGVISTDGHLNLLTASFPCSHAPLWALLIALPNVNCEGDVKSTFSLENFSPPPAIYPVSQLADRAPPSLI